MKWIKFRYSKSYLRFMEMFVEIIVVFFVDSLFFVCNFLIEYVFSVVEEFGRFSECVGMEFGCVFCLGF